MEGYMEFYGLRFYKLGVWIISNFYCVGFRLIFESFRKIWYFQVFEVGVYRRFQGFQIGNEVWGIQGFFVVCQWVSDFVFICVLLLIFVYFFNIRK